MICAEVADDARVIETKGESCSILKLSIKKKSLDAKVNCTY